MGKTLSFFCVLLPFVLFLLLTKPAKKMTMIPLYWHFVNTKRLNTTYINKKHTANLLVQSMRWPIFFLLYILLLLCIHPTKKMTLTSLYWYFVFHNTKCEITAYINSKADHLKLYTCKYHSSLIVNQEVVSSNSQ